MLKVQGTYQVVKVEMYTGNRVLGMYTCSVHLAVEWSAEIEILAGLKKIKKMKNERVPVCTQVHGV